MEILDRDINAPFMLPISEKYNELGTMVMGKVESGRVKKGDSLLLMPNKVCPYRPSSPTPMLTGA
jgi:peptide chain release factor subunit 3